LIAAVSTSVRNLRGSPDLAIYALNVISATRLLSPHVVALVCITRL
jgi:hypothetical protein